MRKCDSPHLPADITPYGHPQYEEQAGDGGGEGRPGRGPGDVHAEAEQAEDGTSEYSEDAQPGLHQTWNVPDQEGQQVAEYPKPETEKLGEFCCGFFLEAVLPERLDDVLESDRGERVQSPGHGGESTREHASHEKAGEAGHVAEDVHHEEREELILGVDQPRGHGVAVEVAGEDDEAGIGHHGEDYRDGQAAQPDGDLGSPEHSAQIRNKARRSISASAEIQLCPTQEIGTFEN